MSIHIDRKERLGITPAIRRAVCGEGLFTNCAYCDTPFPPAVLQVDHIIPFSMGGADSLENYTPACPTCNAEKSDMDPGAWALWREQRGWPWPIPSGAELIADLAPLLVDVFGDAIHVPPSALAWTYETVREFQRVGVDMTRARAELLAMACASLEAA